MVFGVQDLSWASKINLGLRNALTWLKGKNVFIMFDLGFWEFCLIAVVALLVFGPEKLPGAARTAGLWIGRARRFIGSIKQDIDKELHLQEMQDAIKNNDETGLHQFIEETKTGLSDLNKPISLDPTKPTEDNSASSETNSSHKSETS